jgi:hypothetical protein
MCLKDANAATAVTADVTTIRLRAGLSRGRREQEEATTAAETAAADAHAAALAAVKAEGLAALAAAEQRAAAAAVARDREHAATLADLQRLRDLADSGKHRDSATADEVSFSFLRFCSVLVLQSVHYCSSAYARAVRILYSNVNTTQCMPLLRACSVR